MPHTNGPWETASNEVCLIVRAVWHPGVDSGEIADRVICEVSRRNPKNEANARLIAAAPDLLQRLEAIYGDCERYLEGKLPDYPIDDMIAGIRDVCDTGIARATGD